MLKFDRLQITFNAAITMSWIYDNAGVFVLLLFLACASSGLLVIGIAYLICHIITLWPTSESQSNEFQLNELQLDTRIGCGDGLCYLPMFQTTYHVRVISELGHFPTIVALAGIAKSYRRKIKGKLTLIEDGVAHFEQDKNERLVWEVVEELVGHLDFIESRQVRVVSSRPPEGYRYLELFLPEHRNFILRLLGSFPSLQSVVNINTEYRMGFIGVLWQKERDRYVLEKELDMDVWVQIGKCIIRPEARID